jgi:hypothetical protein
VSSSAEERSRKIVSSMLVSEIEAIVLEKGREDLICEELSVSVVDCWGKHVVEGGLARGNLP